MAITFDQTTMSSEQRHTLWKNLEYELERVYMKHAEFSFERDKAGGADKLAQRMVAEVRKDLERGGKYDWLTHNSVVLRPMVKRLFGFSKSKRLAHPLISKNSIQDIIVGDGVKFLSPERRFDAVVVNAPGIDKKIEELNN